MCSEHAVRLVLKHTGPERLCSGDVRHPVPMPSNQVHSSRAWRIGQKGRRPAVKTSLDSSSLGRSKTAPTQGWPNSSRADSKTIWRMRALASVLDAEDLPRQERFWHAPCRLEEAVDGRGTQPKHAAEHRAEHRAEHPLDEASHLKNLQNSSYTYSTVLSRNARAN